MVFGQVIAGEAAALGQLDELQTVPIELRQRDPRDPLNVIENSELDGHRDLLSSASNPCGGRRSASSQLGLRDFRQ
jgi:hypothetical protein